MLRYVHDHLESKQCTDLADDVQHIHFQIVARLLRKLILRVYLGKKKLYHWEFLFAKLNSYSISLFKIVSIEILVLPDSEYTKFDV